MTDVRRNFKRKLTEAENHHHTAAESIDALDLQKPVGDKDALAAVDRLRNSSKSAIQLASTIEKQYGDAAIVLHQYKDAVTFASKHRDHVTSFESQVFFTFRAKLPKDISAVAASALATKNGVLSTLADLARADPEDEDAKAFIKTFGWVKGAWEAAVKKRGMSLPDYEAVRAFKQKSNNSFHDADPPRDALRVLESPAPVPEELQQYREPLKALLKALTMKQ